MQSVNSRCQLEPKARSRGIGRPRIWPHPARESSHIPWSHKRRKTVAERAGYRREGVLRDYYVDESGVIDIVMFARLRTDVQ